MSKRETRSFAASGVDVDAPRAKRRKEASATSTSGTSITIKPLVNASPIGDAPAGDESGASPVEDPAVVKEKGLGVWNTLKDAVNKDGQIASFQFMRLPSRRQYADYYNIIKHPIALDDIKSKLERREYASLEDLRQDFDTCFRNAKRYNMRESQIWKDAKFLHKLSAKELDKLTGKEDRDGEGSDDDGEKKKAPSMYRLLKSRLQKLVDKKDNDGRALSTEFMVLPSRKLWPMYYQIIKKPQCLDNIFKRLKQKEYPTPKDFANDVELIFSNALEFNQEHTPIWEDAVVLREHFRKLMSDLPEPYTIPTYENPGQHSTKIRLKVPQLHPPPPPQPVAAPTPSLPSSNSIVIPSRAPAKAPTKPIVTLTAPAPSPKPSATVVGTTPVIPAILPASTPTPAPPQAIPSQAAAAAKPPRPAAVPATPLAPLTASQAKKPAHSTTQVAATPSHAPPTANGLVHAGQHHNAAFQPPLTPSTMPAVVAPAPQKKAPSISPAALDGGTAPAAQIQQHGPAQSLAQARTSAPPAAAPPPPPVAETVFAHPLRRVVITTLPLYRRLVLDHGDGVRTWAMRLDGSEATVVVSDVAFIEKDKTRAREEDDGDSSADEAHPRREEEEEEEADERERSSSSPSRRRTRSPRKRGRPARTAKKTQQSPGKGKAAETPRGETEVKLNGVSVTERDAGTWEVLVGVGSSILEVGEKGGMMWKVYLDRSLVQ